MLNKKRKKNTDGGGVNNAGTVPGECDNVNDVGSGIGGIGNIGGGVGMRKRSSTKIPSFSKSILCWQLFILIKGVQGSILIFYVNKQLFILIKSLQRSWIMLMH